MKRYAKQNAVLELFEAPELENFLSLKKKCLNTSRKHGTVAMLYLTKCYSYKCVR
jgi:hypothetical protein